MICYNWIIVMYTKEVYVQSSLLELGICIDFRICIWRGGGGVMGLGGGLVSSSKLHTLGKCSYISS